MKQTIKTKYLTDRIISLLLLIVTIGLLGGCTTAPGALPRTDQNQTQNGIITGHVELDQSEGINLSTVRVPNTSLKPEGSNNKKSNVIFSSGIEETEDNPTNTYIIKFNSETDQGYIYNNILTVANGVLQDSVKELSDNTYKIKLNPEKIATFKNRTANFSSVQYIEPDYRIKVQTIPDDPHYSEQWNLEMLNLSTTWEKYKGSRKVKVAVVDTGIISDHPDLAENIGPGYDVIDEDYDPSDPSTDFSHGTQVAGIIGAVTDNSTGIAGINWNVEIMPVRVMDKDGNGIVSNLATGIKWAVDNGADIINLSLASSGASDTLKNAVQYAVDNDVAVVAASGNNGRGQVSYPARYSTVISVGAIGPTRKKADYSNYGESLDLVAPGGDSKVTTTHNNTILTTTGANKPYRYYPAQGTSMATPHVSGIAALLYSSGITGPEEIKQRLINTATTLDSTGMNNSHYGAGLVNINRALGLEIKDKESYRNISGKILDISNVKLFTVKSGTENKLTDPTLKSNPNQYGDYNLSSPPGERQLIAWLDVNQDNKINSNDYYAEVPVSVQEAKKVSGINLDLKKVK